MSYREKIYKSFDMKYIITKEYIESEVYKNTMEKYIDEDCNLFRQEENADNWIYRSSKLLGLGCWKWLSTYRHKTIISSFVFSDGKGIDFGGHNGPIWGNTEIIDIFPPKMYRKIEHIKDGELDYIFTSHTLEHIKDLDYTLRELYRVLKEGGYMIVIVPAWNCERWRADQNRSGHVWTFDLGIHGYTNIEKKIKKSGFIINEAEYTYDNSIYILAVK